MLQSFLIIGGDKEKRWQYAQKIAQERLGKKQIKSHPDFFLIIGLNSIGIEKIRELEKRLALKPYESEVKVTIINEAEKLTLPAQNSLLKILEEPPGNSLIILTAPQKNFLLPTIISRCKIIRLKEKVGILTDKNLNLSKISKIQRKNKGECLKIARLYSNTKDQAINFCQQLLLKEREFFLNEPDVKKARNIRYILKTIRLLESNINPILATGNLLLKLVK